MGPRDLEGKRRWLPDSYIHSTRWRSQTVPVMWRSMDDLPDVEKTYDYTDKLFEIFYG